MRVMIGNFVSWYGKPTRIMNRNEVFEISSGKSPASPLEITPEILEDRFRFIHDKGLWIHKSTGFSLVLSHDENLVSNGFKYTKLPSVVFKEVHNLQNFFAIVTGETL